MKKIKGALPFRSKPYEKLDDSDHPSNVVQHNGQEKPHHGDHSSNVVQHKDHENLDDGDPDHVFKVMQRKVLEAAKKISIDHKKSPMFHVEDVLDHVGAIGNEGYTNADCFQLIVDTMYPGFVEIPRGDFTKVYNLVMDVIKRSEDIKKDQRLHLLEIYAMFLRSNNLTAHECCQLVMSTYVVVGTPDEDSKQRLHQDHVNAAIEKFMENHGKLAQIMVQAHRRDNEAENKKNRHE